jgi:tRNA(adenine34) deaminase
MRDGRMADVERYLHMAMQEAETAAREGNNPFGAVIVDPNGVIVATGRNGVNTEHDPSSHAEMNAVRRACRELQTVSLAGYWLFTNGAPCTMCSTVMIAARLSAVWYAAPADSNRTMPTLEELVERGGATGLVVHQGILAEQATEQLSRLSGR